MLVLIFQYEINIAKLDDKDEKSYDCPIDLGKVFDKIQHLFMIKIAN